MSCGASSERTRCHRFGPWSLVLLCAFSSSVTAALSEPAYAQASCGTIGFAQGELTTGQALAATMPLTDVTVACLTAVAGAVAKRPELRTLTVIVRLPDAERKQGESMAIAKAMSDLLQAKGVPKRKISVVAPAVGHNQAAGVKLVYSERRQGRAIGKLTVVQGTVSTGANPAALSSAVEGTTLRANDYLATAAESQARLALADGSVLSVRPSTLVRLGNVALTAEYQRQVQIEILDGSAEVTAATAKPGSIFQMITRAAVAGVRGTDFRITVQDNGITRLETTSGEVSLGNPGGQKEVRGGYGSRAAVGSAPEKPRPLIAPPTRMSPIQGSFASAPTVSWEPATGATSYVVELARSAKFVRQVMWISSNSPSATVKPPAEGRWFWRVFSVDADGFVGMPSKIFSFVIDSSAERAPVPE